MQFTEQKTQQTVNIRGVDHYYRWIRQGEGDTHKPVLVFVHGWGGSSRYWETTAQAFAPQFDCLLYDLRGFGRSRLPDSLPTTSYEMGEYVEDLAIFLDQLGLETVYLNGHSVGASIATLFTSRYPQRVEKLILTCSGVFAYNPITFPAFHKAGTVVVKLRYNWFLKVPLAGRLFMARFVHRALEDQINREFLEDYLEADYEAAVGTIYTAVSQQAAQEMPEAFASLDVPTLLVAGKEDIIIPTKLAKRAVSLNPETVQYVEIPNTAHFPMLEDRETYDQAVQEFLNG
ncbi:alpha/beta hydrolase [Spirulina sp. CS-785/01]|uniref:alpha/beta fold hydrolase n=1 Tax=Spirulina sp. CS-785/01 TaxID=3021716 RepID=UPI00232DFECB|nr:alpha/beta hydrolase [Spirulina sp. CS-785/01]MDB9312003.1 alpha/beta hydrolase [Spirulina sp. CS-785/01]